VGTVDLTVDPTWALLVAGRGDRPLKVMANALSAGFHLIAHRALSRVMKVRLVCPVDFRRGRRRRSTPPCMGGGPFG
jgi:hypothetical protein